MTLFANSAGFSRFVPGYTENLGIALSGGTFSVQGARAALSQDNAAYISIQDRTTAGLQRVYRITANQTFTDGSAGTTDNQRFGLTTGVNWAQDIPFFLYAVQNDAQTAVAFMISRNSAATVSPASASIGQSGAVVNVGQGDFFSLASITATDYDANSCTYIGCFRMQFTGATDSWTVQTVTQGVDGVGLNYDNRIFQMPTGVNGSTTGTYFQNVATVEPIYTTQQLSYIIRRNGSVNVFFSGRIATTAGTGAGVLSLTMPYTIPFSNIPAIGGSYFRTGGTTSTRFDLVLDAAPQVYFNFQQSGIAGNVQQSTIVLGSDLTAVGQYYVYATP